MRWSVACAAFGLLALAAALVWTADSARAEGRIWLEERTASSLTVAWHWLGPAAAFEMGWRASGDGASTVWRTARVSGAERSYRIEGLETEVRHVVRVRALDVNGRMLGDLRSVFTPREAEPLWLGLGMSGLNGGDFCVEAGVRDLFWNIGGGVPPYTLTIDGESVAPDSEYFRVFCGLRPSDPQPCDPEPKQHQTFNAVATDSRGVAAEAEFQAVVAVPPNRKITGSILPPGTASGAAVRLAWLARPDWLDSWLGDSAACVYELRYQSTAWDADSWPEEWTTIDETIAAGADEYLHSGLDPDRRYRYQVRARNNIGAGEWSRPFPRTAARPGAAVLAARTAASGSVALSWSAAPNFAARWEYRRRPAGGGRVLWTALAGWSPWTTFASSGGYPARRIVSGLTEDVRYDFQVRAVTAVGPGRASATATAAAGLTPTGSSGREPHIGPDGVRILPSNPINYPVEGGHTYRLSDTGYGFVIDVPAGMRLIYRGTTELFFSPGGSWDAAVLEDEASGARLLLAFPSGEELGRYIPPEYGSSRDTRDVGALFDAIAASVR